MDPRQHNIGAYTAVRAAGGGRLVAAGTGDNTEVSGPYVQRPAMAQSCQVVITANTVLTDTKTLTISGLTLQDATDGSGTGVGDFATSATTLVLTGETGGTTEDGVLVIDVDLAGAKEYLRVQYTPDLSHSGTDIAQVTAALHFGGFPNLPQAAVTGAVKGVVVYS